MRYLLVLTSFIVFVITSVTCLKVYAYNIEPGQDLTTNANTMVVKGAVSDALTAVTVSVAMDDQFYSPPVTNGLFEQTVSFLSEKPYVVTITATDEAGNVVSVTRNIIYDATKPILTIAPIISPTIRTSQTITGTREEGGAVAVVCPTATVGAVSYPSATTWQVVVTDLRLGDNVVTVSSADAAGNQTTLAAMIAVQSPETMLTVTATPRILWPPNHKLVPVTIGGGILYDPGDIQTIDIHVIDEYGKYSFSHLDFGGTILLEAWRDGADMDGRSYAITAVATHRDGRKSTATTNVLVPHDKLH